MMASPQHEVTSDEEESAGIHSGRIVPVYEKLGPLTGRSPAAHPDPACVRHLGELPDPLPTEVRERLGVTGRAEALRRVHAPGEEARLEELNSARSPAHLRLILEEFFLFQLGLARRRRGLRGERKGIAFEITDQPVRW